MTHPVMFITQVTSIYHCAASSLCPCSVDRSFRGCLVLRAQHVVEIAVEARALEILPPEAQSGRDRAVSLQGNVNIANHLSPSQHTRQGSSPF